MPNDREHGSDAVVIRMGLDGEAVDGRLAEAGLDVIGIEKQLVGGGTLLLGLLSVRMMIRTANLLAKDRRIPGMVGDSTVTPDLPPVARRIRAEATDAWDDGVAAERSRGKTTGLCGGEGRLAGAGRLAVVNVTIEAARGIILATGTEATHDR